MYSVEDNFTFENLQEWIENARDSISDLDSFVWALVGNKSDLPLEIEHDKILARQEQLETELSFFTSAKSGENVVATFERIVEAIHDKQSGDKNKPCASSKKTVKIKSIGDHQSSSKGCAC